MGFRKIVIAVVLVPLSLGGFMRGLRNSKRRRNGTRRKRLTLLCRLSKLKLLWRDYALSGMQMIHGNIRSIQLTTTHPLTRWILNAHW